MPKLPGEAQQLPIPQPSGRLPASPQVNQGAGVINVGNALINVGESFAREYEKEQNRINKIQVEDAFTQLRQKQIELSIGEQEGFTNKKSGDAIKEPILRDWSTKLQEHIETIASGLKNDEQRQAFRLRANVTRNQFRSDIMRHVMEQNQVYQKQNMDATIATETQLATIQWNAPENVKASIKRVTEAAKEYADANGLDKEATETLIRMKTADIHKAVVSQAVDKGNPDYAQLWISQNKEDMDAKTLITAEKLTKEGRQIKLAQTVADEVDASGMTETQALAMVRKKYTGDDRRAIEEEIKHRYAEDRRIENENEADAADAAYRMYADSKASGNPISFNDIPPSLRNQMKGRSVEALRHYIETEETQGTRTKTDPETYNNLITMLTENPAKFANEDLMQYRNKLSEPDFERFLKQKMDLRLSNVSAQVRLKALKNVVNFGKSRLVSEGISPTAKKGRAADRFAEFQQDAMERINHFFEVEKREPTFDEVQKITNELLQKGYTRDWVFDDEKLFFELKPEELGKFYLKSVGEIPTKELDKIKGDLEKRKIDVTNKNIEDEYTWRVLNKTNIDNMPKDDLEKVKQSLIAEGIPTTVENIEARYRELIRYLQRSR